MTNVVVFDVETDRLLDKTRSNYEDLRITVAAAYSTRDETMHTCFGDREGGLDPLATLFDDEATDVVVAYNGRGFDFRVLKNHFPLDRVRAWEQKLIDPFEVIREQTGSWVKLDELLEANGLPRKSANGVAAVEWWADGRKEEVAEYCRDDVQGLVDLLALGKFVFPIKRWEGRTQVVSEWAELDWATHVAWLVDNKKRRLKNRQRT